MYKMCNFIGARNWPTVNCEGNSWMIFSLFLRSKRFTQQKIQMQMKKTPLQSNENVPRLIWLLISRQHNYDPVLECVEDEMDPQGKIVWQKLM